MDFSLRKKDMLSLRFDYGWTLRAIGNKYGMSRERIRQIIGNTGFIAKKRSDILKNEQFLKSTAYLTNRELAKALNLKSSSIIRYRGNIRHAIEPSNKNTKTAFDSEILASALLQNHGIKNKLMNFQHSYDILALDFIRIDVKLANTPKSSPSRSTISPSWRFRVRKGEKRNTTDFYFCVIGPTEEVFIIPADKVPKNMANIVFCWPTTRPELSKWQHYLNAYYLIKEFS